MSQWGKTSGLSAFQRADHEPMPMKPQQCHRIARTEGALDNRIDQGAALPESCITP